MGCRPMPNDVLLRSGTKGALILRYDDDGYSAVFSEILQCIRKRAEPRDVEWAVRACRVQVRYGVVFQARGARSIGDRGKMSISSQSPEAQTRQWLLLSSKEGGESVG